MRGKRLPWWVSLLSRLAAAAGLIVGAVILVGLWRMTPPGDNPFIPLSLDHEAGTATALKLARAIADPDDCMAMLARTSTAFVTEPIEDRRTARTCGFENAVAIERSVTPYSAPVRASCPLAATLFVWERDVLQPLAAETLGQEVARIEHYGSYSCRNIRGGRSNEPSQHATANAIDVYGFRLADGEVVTVEGSWSDEGPKGRFIRALHERSCALFRGVLGPEYNALHENHFHLDMGPYSLCR